MRINKLLKKLWPPRSVAKVKYGIIIFEGDKHKGLYKSFPEGSKESDVITKTKLDNVNAVFIECRIIASEADDERFKTRVQWLRDHYIRVILPRKRKATNKRRHKKP
jgi:hypothetical protein